MTHGLRSRARWSVSAVALTTAFAFASPALAQVEEIIVSAQKKEEALQSVPIAVSAFDAGALDRQQIDSFADLQFNVPNVSYTRGNFGSGAGNFQIRGIGSAAVAASGDGGVGFHVNDVYLNAARIGDMEYYDLEGIEILRGPQGTLYGRNATGGVVNVKTAKPVLGEFGMNAELQYGNFEHARIKGMVNIPLGDKIAFRGSGIILSRDGYTENDSTTADFDDIDDRSQYSFRGALRVQPFETTTIDIMGWYYEEDDSRVRGAKQMCLNDPSAVLGCLPTGLGFETTNPDATLGGLLATDLVLGALGLTTFGTNAQAPNPADLRKTILDFEPIFQADETFLSAQIQHDLTDQLTLTLVGAMHETTTFSEQDYNNVETGALTLPAALAAFPLAAAMFPGGLLPVSNVDPANAGIFNSNIREYAEGIQAYDRALGSAEEMTFEARINSNFDGPFNFLLAGYYLDFEGDADYYVIANSLDYFSIVGGAALVADGFGLPTPFFNSETDKYTLESYAFFGESYLEVSPTVKLTAGLRWTHDEKTIRDRQLPLVSGGATALPTSPLYALSGGPYSLAELEAVWLGAGYDADASVPGQQLYREAEVTFEEFTGRFVVDWTPTLSFTDDTLLYASFSRGYRGGGFNPPFDPALFAGTQATFDPEFINAYEIGTKNTLVGGTVQANLTGFYYDYEGLQISKIVNRTSVNENIDAIIWGLEGEFIWAPDDKWLFSMNASYLNTEVGDASSVDGRDPTNGESGVTLLKSLTDASNCVVDWNGNPDPVGVFPGFVPAGATAGIVEPTAYSALGCGAALQTALDGAFGVGAYTASGGIEKDLEGNSLANSPEFTVSVGAQYTHTFGNGSTLTPRLDYYWQDEFYTRIFNRPETDLVDAWDMANARVTYADAEGRFTVSAFIQNIFDDDNVTGHYFTDPSSGNFTNIFVVEPRLYGINLGVTF